MDVKEIMTPEEIEIIGVNGMSDLQRKCLMDFALRVQGMGQHTVGDIVDIKYDAKVIVLDDGSSWVVDDLDKYTAELWTEYEKVVVIDDEMYKLDESEKVMVSEDLD